MDDKKIIVTDNNWVEVIRTEFPQVGAEDYIYVKALKDTVAAIVYDLSKNKFAMRLEGTLSSNFSPILKIMTETAEPEDVDSLQTCLRGIQEEYGTELNEYNTVYLGAIEGTYQELHSYQLYFVIADSINEDFSGDGSVGEEKSKVVFIDGEEFNTVSDFLSWIAYGMMKNQMTFKPEKFINSFTSEGLRINPSEFVNYI